VRAVRAWQGLALASVTKRWRERCARERVVQFYVARALIRLNQRMLSKGLTRWRLNATHLRRASGVAARHWLHQQGVIALQAWRGALRSIRRQRVLQRKGTVHWATEKAQAAMARLYEAHMYKADALAAHRHATAHWVSLSLAQGLHTWYTSLLHWRESQAGYTRVAHHWILRQGLLALRKWREQVAERLKAWRLIRQASGFMAYRLGIGTLKTWRAAAEAIRERLAHADFRGMAHCRTAGLWQGVNKLSMNAEFSLEAQDTRARAVMHWAVHTLRRAKCSWVLASLAQRKRLAELRRRLRRANTVAVEAWNMDHMELVWGTWREEAEARAERRYLHRLAIGEWARRVLTQAVRHWAWRAAELRELAEEMHAARLDGVEHWNRNMVAKGTDRWAEEAELRHQRGVDHQDAVLHWAEGRLVAATNQWRRQAYAWYCAKAATGGAANWCDEGALVGALGEWRAKTAQWRSRADHGSRKAMQAWNRRHLRRSLEEWRRCTRTATTGSELYSQAAFWWLHRTLDVTLRRWRDYSEFCVILEELMSQADFRYYHKSYSDGFQAWRSYSDMVQDGEK